MNRKSYTHNRFHLGDNLIFLHLLRSIAKGNVSVPFVHFCHAHLIPQLQEVVADLPNILLEPFESPLWPEREREAIDTWKNAEGFWEGHDHRWDWSAFTLAHHAWTAARMGFVSPFTCREQLLFDYPALEKPQCPFFENRNFLVINSEPNSGQFKPMAEHGTGYLDHLVVLLRDAGHELTYTKEISKEIRGDFVRSKGTAHFTGAKVRDGHASLETVASISDIGSMSRTHQHIIGVATGPLWPCINTHNNHTHEGRRFIALLDNGENVNMPGWEQCATVDEVMEIARQEGWI